MNLQQVIDLHNSKEPSDKEYTLYYSNRNDEIWTAEIEDDGHVSTIFGGYDQQVYCTDDLKSIFKFLSLLDDDFNDDYAIFQGDTLLSFGHLGYCLRFTRDDDKTYSTPGSFPETIDLDGDIWSSRAYLINTASGSLYEVWCKIISQFHHNELMRQPDY